MPHFYLFLILNSSSVPSCSLCRRCSRLLITLFAPSNLFIFFSSARFLLTYGVQKCIQYSSWGKTFPIPLSNNALTGKRTAHILAITKNPYITLLHEAVYIQGIWGQAMTDGVISKVSQAHSKLQPERMQLVEIWKTLIASGSKQHNTSVSFSTCSKTFWIHTVSTLNLGKVICI